MNCSTTKNYIIPKSVILYVRGSFLNRNNEWDLGVFENLINKKKYII